MEDNGESWDEMAQRVTAEVNDVTYAQRLFNAMTAYRSVGFSDEQAWELTLEEHHHRLGLMTANAVHNLYTKPEEDS